MRGGKRLNRDALSLRGLYEWVQVLVCAVTATVLLFTFAARVVLVSGPSMRETLQHQDCLLVMNAHLCGGFEAGDIVIIRKESFKDGEPIVKRVIATEGQTVDIDFTAGAVYVDGQLLYTSYEHIPTPASRLWLGIWFPASKDSDGDGFGDTGWTGTADFDTAVFEIDSVRITPYCEAGDTVGNETYPKDGWSADSFPEDIEAERYEHIRNGDFSAGAENWTAYGGAEVSDGRGILRTGSATHTLSQSIAVQPNMTYTLKADIVSDGTRVTLGGRKANGSANTHEIYTDSGEKFLIFTTGKSCLSAAPLAGADAPVRPNPRRSDQGEKLFKLPSHASHDSSSS